MVVLERELARAGGVVGALGLALLILGPSRLWRLVGLVAWAAGCACARGVARPGGPPRRLRRGGGRRRGRRRRCSRAAPPRPWLLAVLVLACAPARIPVSVGSTKANLLVPMYFVVVAAALALAWQLFWDERPRARARPARVAARPARRLARALAPLDGRPARGRDRDALLRAPVRPARARARAAAVADAQPRAAALRPAARDGARLRRDRRLSVVHARRVLEPG